MIPSTAAAPGTPAPTTAAVATATFAFAPAFAFAAVFGAGTFLAGAFGTSLCSASSLAVVATLSFPTALVAATLTFATALVGLPDAAQPSTSVSSQHCLPSQPSPLLHSPFSLSWQLLPFLLPVPSRPRSCPRAYPACLPHCLHLSVPLRRIRRAARASPEQPQTQFAEQAQPYSWCQAARDPTPQQSCNQAPETVASRWPAEGAGLANHRYLIRRQVSGRKAASEAGTAQHCSATRPSTQFAIAEEVGP